MKKNEPLVSVIMNCYNGDKFLREAIDSVLAQTYTNFEIIFWDNQSTDKSAEIVKSYADKRIKYFLGEEHVSLGRARNLAIQKAKGDYIAFLDVDDLWEPDKLNKQIPFFDNPSVGLVYCQTKIVDLNSKIVGHYFHLKPVVNKYSLFLFSNLYVEYDIVMSSAIISQKALLLADGKFDNLLKYAEEFDLFMRILSKFKAIRVEEPLTLYRVHDRQDTLTLFERSLYEEEYIMHKLKLLYPDLFEKNTNLFEKKKKGLAWRYFLNNCLKGRTHLARRYLLPFIFHSLKYLIFFLLSFMGGKPILYIWEKHRKKNGELPIIS